MLSLSEKNRKPTKKGIIKNSKMKINSATEENAVFIITFLIDETNK